ncbi:MAG: ABC transporter ATP-binding protein, partial [Rhodobacteraceae bacterium]|nr:ABC transporter ATP-binding protein [Paracoccaceae bacterium]
MTQQEISVSFDKVQKLYGTVEALKPTSFDIREGELVTLLGPSGCGKTTTLRLLAGLELASSGSISIGGKDVTHLTATYRNVSMVFQSYALFPHMTVVENTAYGLTVEGMKKSEAQQTAEHFLEMVGLEGFGARLPSELSGGQQQRVAVARAIVLEPEVLLLDEPLSNLDAKLRRHVREEIRQIQQKLGLTALYVTHDQEEAMTVASRVAVMDEGRLMQVATPDEIYEFPNSVYVADFIGDVNIIEGTANPMRDDRYLIAWDEGSEPLVTISNQDFAAGQRCHLAIRPEKMRISVEKPEKPPNAVQ